MFYTDALFNIAEIKRYTLSLQADLQIERYMRDCEIVYAYIFDPVKRKTIRC